MYTYATVYMQWPWKREESIGSLATRITEGWLGCEPTHGCRETNLGSVQ